MSGPPRTAAPSRAVPIWTLALAFAACDAGPRETRESARGIEPDTGALASLDATPGVPNDPSATGRACGLLTERQVEEALGFEVARNDNASGGCLVTADDGSPAAPTLDYRIEERTTAYDYFAAQPDADAVAGLGERAVWATMNDMTGQLAVITHGRAVVVAVSRADGLDTADRRQAEAIARAILENSTR